MACVDRPARQRLHERHPNKHAGERISGNGPPVNGAVKTSHLGAYKTSH
jgi:hypothetical protein